MKFTAKLSNIYKKKFEVSNLLLFIKRRWTFLRKRGERDEIVILLQKKKLFSGIKRSELWFCGEGCGRKVTVVVGPWTFFCFFPSLSYVSGMFNSFYQYTNFWHYRRNRLESIFFLIYMGFMSFIIHCNLHFLEKWGEMSLKGMIS